MYLDYAATAPPKRAILEAMWPYLTTEFGNPASNHDMGFRAQKTLDDASQRVLELLGFKAGTRIVFTSGGTESNNLALRGFVEAQSTPAVIITSAVEHSSVIATTQMLGLRPDVDVIHVPHEPDATVTPQALKQCLLQVQKTHGEVRILVSLMTANNEVGSINDIAALTEVAHAHGALFHTDAVQATGAHVLCPQVDMLSMSGHKLGSPKGMGALALAPRVVLAPQMYGGKQQDGLRSGTENPAAAVALAAALALSPVHHVAAEGEANQIVRMQAQRDAFIATVMNANVGAQLTGNASARLPGHISLIFPGISGDALLQRVAERGYQVSAGSACSARTAGPSHVIAALGFLTQDALSAVRISFGADTDPMHVQGCAEEIVKAAQQLRSLG